MSKKESAVDGWRRFVDLCLKAKSRVQIEDLFKLLLTFQERRNVAKRLQLVIALIEGKMNQRDMAKQFKISIGRITRGSNALKTINPDLRSYLDTHK